MRLTWRTRDAIAQKLLAERNAADALNEKNNANAATKDGVSQKAFADLAAKRRFKMNPSP